jgi:hypothetical protein
VWQQSASTLGFAFEPLQDLRVGEMTAIPRQKVWRSGVGPLQQQ